MMRVTGFFNDRRGIAAIDYGFVALLAYAVRDLALSYGGVASPIIKHVLRIG